ncbi:MAG TPA: aldo/keto reductase [Kofleriaceae bacterium]|jgi:aryl-alcohol dehydrogenase-like predicted oxidoreductase
MTAAGTIAIGDLTIHRLGFGAMRLTGPGIFGPPRDLDGARATLRALPELGIDFIDTANAYGPIVSELLVREVLHPYRGLVIATKGGFLRPGPNQWLPDGRPESLRTAVDSSLKVLGIERIDLWHLHRVDPKVPAGEQFAAVAELQREGKLRHVGLSEVSVEQIAAASQHFTVASVQNGYHLIERKNEPVLAHCERAGIPFIAYFPLATGALAAPDSILTTIAAELGATPAQVAIAWLLRRSRSLIAIPGTSRVDHARENVAAASLELTDEQFTRIERIGKKAALLRQPR